MLGPSNAPYLRLVGIVLLVLPVVHLAYQAQTSPFAMWLGAVSVVGWIIALRRPSQRAK